MEQLNSCVAVVALHVIFSAYSVFSAVSHIFGFDILSGPAICGLWLVFRVGYRWKRRLL